jgi:hypothetical protein
MVGSIGLGMLYKLVPMKLGISYAMGAIDVNAGMALYMITDDSYSPIEGDVPGTEEVEDWKGSSNEPGINFGIVYNMNDVGIGVGYDIIKSGVATLDAVTIHFSYAFGGNSAD